jgi:hypothetical protein
MYFKITLDAKRPARCTLHTRTWDGTERVRDFFTDPRGGYVRENWNNPRQICERLSSTGPTLRWIPSKKYPTLAHLIRREYRRRVRYDAY